MVALFARLRLVVDATNTTALFESASCEPRRRGRDCCARRAATSCIGAFAPLASFALFHLVTVFPLSWVILYTQQSITRFLVIQMVGAVLAAGAIVPRA